MSPTRHRLRYVVHEHAATHHHYDLRLEWDGALKSWAVPKGPSLDPADRRLAVQVEDHPLEYARFEGRLPEGEYGAGEVLLWDRGTWTPEGDAGEALRAGHLQFRLHGRKLRGAWDLVRLKRRPGETREHWLLVKERDDAARRGRSAGVTRTRRESVKSGATIEALEHDPADALTHPSRVLYPSAGVTKQDVADYYARVAPLMLPHVAGRPLMILRCPQGEGRHCFYQKNVTSKVPPGLSEVRIPGLSGRPDATYLRIRDERGLVALVQLGVLEIHVWGATAPRLETPDRIVFDLDPGAGVAWADVVAAARTVKGALEDYGLVSFVKSTGGRGAHVVVPIARGPSWTEARAFARGVAERLARREPARFVAQAGEARRKGKVFVDYLRNGRGATAIAPWSTRASEGATVAMPFAWDRWSAVRAPERYTVKSVPGMLARAGADPWAPMLRLAQELPRSRRPLQKAEP